MKKVGIVGFGYVGKAVKEFFRKTCEVHLYDPFLGWDSQEDINKCDVVFICVPTPQDDTGECDTHIVQEVLAWVESPLIIIKSTVSVGTTKRLCEETEKNIIFSPEYIGESSYWSPYSFDTKMEETPFFTFGGDPELCSKAIDLYLPIVGPCKRFNSCTSDEAEMAKYMENAFFATKIAFCNEVYSICVAKGINWNVTRELWLNDPRINPMHTAVFKDDRGFGGKCLPKDTAALCYMAEKEGTPNDVLKGVLSSNKKVRFPEEKKNVHE